MGTTYLLLHSTRSASGVEISGGGYNGANHTLLLEVLIAFVLSQLHNIVLALPTSLIQVDACTKKGSMRTFCDVNAGIGDQRVKWTPVGGKQRHGSRFFALQLNEQLQTVLPFLILRERVDDPGLELILNT